MNVEPNQDDAVLPHFKTRGYTFTAVKTPYAGWDHDKFQFSSVPQNLLLDKQGRQVLKADLETAEGRKYFEQALEALLAGVER